MSEGVLRESEERYGMKANDGSNPSKDTNPENGEQRNFFIDWSLDTAQSLDRKTQYP